MINQETVISGNNKSSSEDEEMETSDIKTTVEITPTER